MARPLGRPTVRRRLRRPGWLPRANPWRRPYLLEALTCAYLAWSLLPIALAVLFSFNDGRSQSVWQGFSLRWYVGDPVNSVLHDPALRAAVLQTLRLSLLTTVIAVPLGVACGIGIDRWRSRVSGTANFVMVISFVVPELLFAVALFFVFGELFSAVHLGTIAEVLALVAWNLSWPALIVRARLASIGAQYEEAAADLGATRMQALRRVLVPMLMPAVFASAVLVFAGVVDDFVIVDLLSSTAATQPMSVLIYSDTHAGNSGPALNALASLMVALSLIVALAGYGAYRLLTRGERASREEALAAVSGI